MLTNQFRVKRFNSGLALAAGLISLGVGGQVAHGDLDIPLVTLDYQWTGGQPIQYVLHEDSDNYWYDQGNAAWVFVGDDGGHAWGLDWDVMATGPVAGSSNSDFVNAHLSITNLTAQPQTFSALVTLALPNQYGDGTLMSGSVSATVSDNTGDGALLTNSGTDPIYSAFIDEGPGTGPPVHTLFDSGFSLAAGPFGSNDDATSFGDPNPIPGPAAMNTISVYLVIELSAFDTANVIGTFMIQQVPAPGALPLLAGLGLVLGGRRRRR